MDEEKQEKQLLEVAKNIRDNLSDERNILMNRLDMLSKLEDAEFMPVNPNKPFEESIDYVMNEKDLVLNKIKMHIDKLEGQILGQEELIFKMSDEGASEHQRQLDMIQENTELKAKVEKLENIVKQIKDESGKENNEIKTEE